MSAYRCGAIEPTQTTEAERRSLWTIVSQYGHTSYYDEVGYGYDSWWAMVEHPPAFRQSAWWAAREASSGDLAGVARLTVERTSGWEGDASFSLAVHGRHRRRGVGRELLDQLVAGGAARGCRSLITEAPQGSLAHELLSAIAAPGLTNLRIRVEVDALDGELLRSLASPPPGYRTAHWSGPTPADRLAGLAAATGAMGDMPAGDLAVSAAGRSVEELRQIEEALVRRRVDWLSVVVLASDEIVGYSQHFFPSDYPELAFGGDTAVAREHRGCGLGGVLRGVMLGTIRSERPWVRVVETSNAAVNAPILALNQRLGFRVFQRWDEWQLALDQLARRQ